MVSKETTSKPKASSGFAQKELDKAEKQFDEFDSQVKELEANRMQEHKKEEVEPQTKLSQEQIERSDRIWLKPQRIIPCQDQFNEKYRKEWEFAKEYVQFIAEHREIIGEAIEIWTKEFAGIPAEEWRVPVNTPVWGPRYLAENIKKRFYRTMKTEESQITGYNQAGTMTGRLVVDKIVQRLDAIPVSTRKSIFMGETNFK